MELSDAIKNRYSCRKYKDVPINEDLLKQCVDTARLAPSACNSQPWKFYIVNSDDLKKEFVGLTQSFTKNASFIVVEEDKPNFQQRIVNKLKEQEFSKIDIGIACSYLCLQASELGLGTCMIGYFNEPKIKTMLGIPANKRLRLVISIGHPAEEEKRYPKRKNIDSILKIF